MSTCACKRGIFVLRDCGQVASAFCTRCGRGACTDHLAVGAQQGLCVECAARDLETAALRADRPADEQWTASYRHRFYTTAGYRPLLEGQRDPYYDEYDVRPFDPELAGGVEADEEREGGFFDS